METIRENDIVRLTETYFTMSDGVRLYTRIATPKEGKTFPIVLIRSPYELSHNGEPHDLEKYRNNQFIHKGFAVVYQHVRGKGDSEGVCTPYQEEQDGLDTLEHIRRLEIYQGEIYPYGGSYLSTVHLSYLHHKPEDIKGAVLYIQTDRMYYRNYRNGCCYDFCNLPWWLSMLKEVYPNGTAQGVLKRPYEDIMKRAIGREYAPFTDLLRHDAHDEFWQNDPRTKTVETLDIPLLMLEGWYDFYVEGMFSMWDRLPPETKKKSAFIVGPWGHATAVSKRAEYPMEHGDIPADYAAVWFDCLRKKKPFPYGEKGKIRYYSMGKDSWESAENVRDTAPKERLYFSGKDSLSHRPLEEELCLSYEYDPEKRLNCYRFLDIYKGFEMNTVEGVLSFLSEPYPQQTDFFGKVRWHMTVSSDCEDTAFFMRVYFVEDGDCYNLTETITSLSHIKKDYGAGEKLTIDLETPPIAFSLKQGSRIRVDISSDGGLYVPHANVKGHWAKVTETAVARNSVYLKDSFIELCKE